MTFKKRWVIVSFIVVKGLCNIPNYVVSSSLIICITDVCWITIMPCVLYGVWNQCPGLVLLRQEYVWTKSATQVMVITYMNESTWWNVAQRGETGLFAAWLSEEQIKSSSDRCYRRSRSPPPPSCPSQACAMTRDTSSIRVHVCMLSVWLPLNSLLLVVAHGYRRT